MDVELYMICSIMLIYSSVAYYWCQVLSSNSHDLISVLYRTTLLGFG